MKCETCQKEFEQKGCSNFCSENCFDIGGQDEADYSHEDERVEFAQSFGSSSDPVQVPNHVGDTFVGDGGGN